MGTPNESQDYGMSRVVVNLQAKELPESRIRQLEEWSSHRLANVLSPAQFWTQKDDSLCTDGVKLTISHRTAELSLAD
jgi:hypothetical protein